MTLKVYNVRKLQRPRMSDGFFDQLASLEKRA